MTQSRDKYIELLVCYQTGQMSERQLTEHLKDEKFKREYEQYASHTRLVASDDLYSSG